MRLIEPLRQRDFALLWTGMAVSLVGDGLLLVALPFQVYALTDDPSALAFAGLAWSLGMVAFLVTGGVLADRVDRRSLLIAADAVRLVAVAALGALSLTGALELWHIYTLMALVGVGEALFGPAFGAIVPDVVPVPQLVQANALGQFARPAALRLVGPVLGGAVVAAAGPGEAFVVDAATFAVSMACVAAMRTRSRAPQAAERALRREVREGLDFVRANTWLWATLVAAAIGLLAFYGPVEVLLPYEVKHDLGGGAGAFGLVLGATGVGSIAGSIWRGQRGMPGRPITSMYVWWTIATLTIAGYAIGTALWQLLILGFVFGWGIAMGMVVWSTLMQTRVPPELLGRVTSLDWLVSIGLTPLSFALTAPVAELAGVEATLIGAGVLGALATAGMLVLVPGLRERGEVLDEGGVRDRGGVHADDLDALARR